MRLILGKIGSFSLGPTLISFTWITLYITGFFFGPIIGLLFGAIADTFGYLLHPGYYMWEYSIQEPLICFAAGLIAMLYLYTKDRNNKITNYIIFEVTLITFCLVGLLVSIIYNTNPLSKSDISPKSLRTSIKLFLENKWIVYIVLPVFFISTNIIYYFTWKKSVAHGHLATYIMILIILVWVTFSWIEGPWAALRFWERKYGINWKTKHDIKMIKKWFLIIRIIKASIIVPIESFITVGLIFALQKTLKNYSKW